MNNYITGVLMSFLLCTGQLPTPSVEPPEWLLYDLGQSVYIPVLRFAKAITPSCKYGGFILFPLRSLSPS